MTIYKHFCKTLFLVGISLSFSLYADQQLEVLEVKTSQSYEISKNLPGELLPFQQSKIAFEITGRISSIYVDIGDRVKKDEWLVMLGVCTHLGCVPLTDKGDYNAWFCPCHGSMFDIVGRVYKGVPAPTNLVVPPHKFEGSILTIGEDGGTA